MVGNSIVGFVIKGRKLLLYNIIFKYSSVCECSQQLKKLTFISPEVYVLYEVNPLIMPSSSVVNSVRLAPGCL